MRRIFVFTILFIGMFYLGTMDSALGKDSKQQLLDSKELAKSYNSVLVDFLVEEGKGKLSDKQRKQALDQCVTALKQRTNVTKDEQLTASLGTAIGATMALFGNDVVSGAGADVESSYSQEWTSWVDAAFKLLHAGYKEDAIQFFTYGMKTIPYTSLRARCVEGLAIAKPDEAYDLLMSSTEKTNNDVLNAALRNLGHLAAQKNISEEKKTAILEKLTKYAGGMKSNDTFHAAIYGLDVSNDKRAVEPLSKYKKGFGKDKYVRRDALRSLLITYDEKDVIDILRKMIKGGFMSTNDAYDELYAGELLLKVRDKAAYKWAEKKLKKKKKGFMSTKKDEVDIRSDVVNLLVEYGCDESKTVLKNVLGKYKDKDWMKTWIATGMLHLGDDSAIDLVRKSLKNHNWDFTAIRITTGLAKYGDYSGIQVLKQLCEKVPPKKSGAKKLFGALAGKKDNTKAEIRRLARLRIQIANALAKMNHEDGVPVLTTLLSDKDQYVRSSAAYALSRMTNAAAINGLNEAVTAEYGFSNKQSRNPIIHAYVSSS